MCAETLLLYFPSGTQDNPANRILYKCCINVVIHWKIRFCSHIIFNMNADVNESAQLVAK